MSRLRYLLLESLARASCGPGQVTARDPSHAQPPAAPPKKSSAWWTLGALWVPPLMPPSWSCQGLVGSLSRKEPWLSVASDSHQKKVCSLKMPCGSGEIYCDGWGVKVQAGATYSAHRLAVTITAGVFTPDPPGLTLVPPHAVSLCCAPSVPSAHGGVHDHRPKPTQAPCTQMLQTSS